MTGPEPDETPPWHAYDGCYGCRTGNAIGKRILASRDEGADQ